jgi:hypothetical protein
MPDWWFTMLGKNNASVVTWMQIDHSANLVPAGLPVACAIAFLFSTRWRSATLIVALVPTSVSLFDAVGGFLMSSSGNEVGFSAAHAVSSSIDVLKVVVIIYALAFIATRFWPTNNERTGSAPPPDALGGRRQRNIDRAAEV